MAENTNGSNKAVGIIITVLIIVVVLTGGWYWFSYKPKQEAIEKARQEQLAKAAAQKKRQEAAARKKAKYDQLITSADKAFEQESWESAKSMYSEAASLYSKEQYPQDQLAIVNEKLDEIAAQSAVGIVQTLSSSTGRFYVVVSSSIDGDLAMDYGNKLAAEGKSVKIIEPFGGARFYRVCLADYNTRDEALIAASSSEEQGAWVLEF
ncbi:MAG: SPOR domain-containing protein [Reichenbachiella sp.]|uniref:SPOR domain-containing protein n=1 Tax=Reichenbachiella sp. TaxID=2184521 RepID=UPI00329764CD